MSQSTGYAPTDEQDTKIKSLNKQGYTWDKQMSMSSAAVVMRKGKDCWYFGLDGSIAHNPDVIRIKL